MYSIMENLVDNKSTNQVQVPDLSTQSTTAASKPKQARQVVQLFGTTYPQPNRSSEQPKYPLSTLLNNLFCTLSTKPTITTNI